MTDASEWEHPRHRMQGGAIQVGRELANLAKKDLSKTLRIVRELEPGLNEIPVGTVLRELVPAGFAVPDFYDLVMELEDKGFASDGFRRDAADAIGRVVNKNFKVPDSLIDRMEQWLSPLCSESSIEDEDITENNQASVLWEQGSLHIIPDGNYPILSALSASCLSSVPVRVERWLEIFEKHADQTESPDVWEALLQNELSNLKVAEHSRADSLIDKLLKKELFSVDARGWVHFVAHAYHWACASSIKRWVMYTINNAVNDQGAGELIGLRHALFPAESWPRKLAYSHGGDGASEAALGLAYSVAHLWHKPIQRPVVHPLMLQLIRSGNEYVLDALSAVFQEDELPADAETRELLDALVAHPNILNSGRAERLPELMVKQATIDPERVCRVSHALLNAAGEQMGDMATSWYLSIEWLLDIALKLQDMGVAESAAGSMLFERMLEFNMPQAREMTLYLDKRLPVIGGVREPLRRRLPSRQQRRQTNRT